MQSTAQNPVLYPALAEILDASKIRRATPYVHYDRHAQCLTIAETTAGVNMEELCTAVVDQFKSDASELNKLKVEVQFNRLNTISSSLLFEVFKVLGKAAAMGKEVYVAWITTYDNIEMIETGMDFQDIYGLDFDFKTR
ncbi:SiaC family regulatory phosphoprotein [Marinoscillum furvescens]|uniref:Uncharacterized protein DUF1987 n=1 Tax=Marinoscillum furvescens DSM 4134 TaxID=1122208 RepID=A0A3D9LHH2_MARFU|nr:SiaC family regulatory phosphoprotein [Marinoscillum furvescens]REE05954.1 uncharacterized protein DUF1987 [Marinoscillum furvescens DSM 4134]